ncbi:MAG: N-formylglutamate amidohydrolase [Alphaproteobacteria bacterium]|nr:N-formylglutamate amidohydrolase [Alphaproteobacteria bacterium]MBV9694818.1 N-formylglutamate amidohydrolase [Alphaproteobacteria bacterium]
MGWPQRSERASDAILAALYAHPFKIHRPAEQRIPFVFASPHSGRLYPASFVAASTLDALTLRRSEDAYADILFEAAAALGAPLLAARFPRAFVDANRAPEELDPAMFSGPLRVYAEAPNARVQAGLGVIPRIVRDGAEIYRGKLDPLEATRRLELLHRPYHAALARLVEETRRRFGLAIVIDCHSMPSAAAVPDVVLGDRHGLSAAAALVDHVERALVAAGFATARNTPYAGGYTTHLYGRRDEGVHALQIEINRALYLDEERIERRADFDRLKTRLKSAMAAFAQLDWTCLPPQRALAAE